MEIKQKCEKCGCSIEAWNSSDYVCDNFRCRYSSGFDEIMPIEEWIKFKNRNRGEEK